MLRFKVHHIFRSNFLFCLLVLPVLLTAQKDSLKIDSFITSQIQINKLPGLSIGIIKNNKILFKKNYGKVSADKDFLIGNLSQTFTALAVMQLVETGKIDLDKPIITYLLWFTLADTANAGRITVRHLLNHSSGLPLRKSFFVPKTKDSTEVVPAYRKMLSKVILVNDPGDDFSYSGINYVLLGFIIESVTQQPFGKFIKENVFDKAGMSHSFADVPEQNTLVPAYQYFWIWQKLADQETFHPQTIPGSFMRSNADDLCGFLTRMIGALNNDSAFAVCSLPFLRPTLSPFNTSHYGMGWAMDNWEGERMYYQRSNTKQYCGFVSFMPDVRTGIVLLSNINNVTTLENINEGILSILNDKQPSFNYPVEQALHFVILLLLAFAIIQFFLRIRLWARRKWKFTVRWSYSNLSYLVVSLLFTVVWIYVIPHYFQMPVSAIITWQPDMGIALIAGTILGVINIFIQLMLRSIRTHGRKRNKDL